jgi:hypothetical protein
MNGQQVASLAEAAPGGLAPLGPRVLELQKLAGNRAVDRLLAKNGSCACGGHAKGGKPCAKCAGLDEKRAVL